MNVNIRDAIPEDAEKILSIYRPYVETTAISFEESVPGFEQMYQQIETVTRNYPWLVYEHEQELLGYAYATRFRARSAYQWTVEVTIYLAEQAKGRGIATELYQALLNRLAQQCFQTALAVITEPNPESERFHQKMGFKKIGTLETVGYKFNQWYNTGWWQKKL